jgi:membrane associated rhomboid family serine protease
MFPVSDVIPSRAKPVVTVALIFLTVSGFLYGWRLGGLEIEALAQWLGVVPVGFAWSTLLTSLLVHAGWPHVATNALYLWLFGSNVEDLFGRTLFFVCYCLCGTAAALAYVAAHPSSTVPLVGASGAIAGVMGAYLVLFPGSRVLTAFFPIVFFDVIEVPAAFYVGLWFLLQLLAGTGASGPATAQGVVALWPLIVGFSTGALCGLYARFRTAALRNYWVSPRARGHSPARS